VYDRAGRYKKALDCYNKALEINPRNAEVLYNKGIILYERNRHRDAIICFDEALEINPKYIEAARAKAVAEAELTRLKK
jgi:tetratricopeptide (TPR) repeat protein